MIFELIVDEKVSIWRRSFIKIEAESLDDAVEDCINNGILNANDIIDSEYLFETEEYIKQDELDNPITIEVMDTHYKVLGSNSED